MKGVDLCHLMLNTTNLDVLNKYFFSVLQKIAILILFCRHGIKSSSVIEIDTTGKTDPFKATGPENVT